MRKVLITLLLMLMAMSSNLSAQEITPGKEVDLGLPSGTIWAGWNVGATSPEEYGDYYAWGETEEKSDYDREAYKYYDNQTGNYINIGSNISGTQYDVARQKWGGSWRMPTHAEFVELENYCKWIWITYKGVKGCKVIGLNGRSIFLPAAGYYYGISLYGDGCRGDYWSATINESDNYDSAWYIFLKEGSYGICFRNSYYFILYTGRSVRPVK